MTRTHHPQATKAIMLKDNFKLQLGLSFFSIGLTFVIALFFITDEIDHLNHSTTSVEELRLPTAQASQRLTNGINQSLAALRGWMILADPQYKQDRQNTWNNVINPALISLKELSGQWTNPENVLRLNNIISQIDDFKQSQLKIENIAHTLDATPATKMLVQQASPIANLLAQHITQLIAQEAKLEASTQRKQLLKAMADFRGSLGLGLADIRLYLISGDKSLQQSFSQRWMTNTISHNYLLANLHLMSTKQKDTFKSLSTARSKFASLPYKMFAIREDDKHNLAQYYLATRAAPMAKSILSHLVNMSSNQQTLLLDDFQEHKQAVEELTLSTGLTIGIGILIVFVMAVTSLKAMARMKERLEQVNQNLTEQNWNRTQIAKLNELTQGSTDLKSLGDKMITILSEMVKAGYGLIYVKDTEQTQHQASLSLLGGYAVIADNCTNTILVGDGLVGQCAKQKKIIQLNQVPEQYYKINSAMGEQQPATLFVLPILFENRLMGVIELACFEPVTELQQQMLNRAADNIGVVINNIHNIEQMTLLLEQTQIQSKTLAKQSSALQQSNTELEQSNIYKSEFLATMSHEIRTPMNGVLGMLGLLSRSGLNSEQLEKAQIAQSSAESLLVIINDILDFSKVDAGKLTLEILDFDLRKMLDDFSHTMATKAQEKGLAFILDVSGIEVSQVSGDLSRIRQILTNIVSNAIKFTSQGEIVITASLQTSQTAHVFNCSVSDTGIGITPARQTHMFDAFEQADASTTREYGGTGLGLSIAKQLCSLMGGDIGVETPSNGGSLFKFSVSLEPGKSLELIKPQLYRQPLNIMVVDQNTTARKVLCHQLELWGAKVTEIKDASTAMTQLSLQKKNSPDIIFIDAHQSSDALVEHVRQLPEYDLTTLIMMTTISHTHKKADATGLNRYVSLNKPLTTSALLNILNGTIGQTVSENLDENNAQGVVLPKWPADTRLLLVEDNIINQTVVEGVLSEVGLSVDVVCNGEEALQMLKMALEKDHYSLIIMDCQMPVMDGYVATQLIRQGEAGECYKDIPIIAMTANSMQGDERKCLEAGMSDYLSKPVNAPLFYEKLEEWLRV